MPTDLQIKWQRVLEHVIGSASYRILGQSSIHAPPAEIFEAILDEVDDPTVFGGEAHWIREPRGTPGFGVLQWSKIWLSDFEAAGPTVSILVWGITGRNNVVFTREGFWRIYLTRGMVERGLGIPPGTLMTRFDFPLAARKPMELKPREVQKDLSILSGRGEGRHGQIPGFGILARVLGPRMLTEMDELGERAPESPWMRKREQRISILP